jgi:hypothetical protein
LVARQIACNLIKGANEHAWNVVRFDDKTLEVVTLMHEEPLLLRIDSPAGVAYCDKGDPMVPTFARRAPVVSGV